MRTGVRVRYDWKAYFQKFSEVHGGDPVVYGGRLLFRDAWMYSSSDYSGPEYSPPEDEKERKALVRFYWMRRRAIIRNEMTDIRNQIRQVGDEQHRRSATLQQTVRYFDTDTKKMQTLRGPADTSWAQDRLLKLTDLLKECEEALA